MICLLCKNKTTKYFSYGSYVGLPQALMRCDACGLLQTDPMPTPAFLADWYQRYDVLGEREPYYQAVKSDNPFDTPEGFEVAYQFTILKRTISRADAVVPCVLDVGSGPGMFLDLVKRAGWKGMGIELNASAATASRERFGVDVITGTIDTTALPLHSFDAVTLWDIFEHVPDPMGLLRRCAELLKSGGLLYIETPNAKSFLDWVIHACARLGFVGPGRTFYGMHHLSLWNPAAMRHALVAQGFTVQDMRGASTPASRIFRTKNLRDRIMRFGVGLIQRVGQLSHRENKMIVVAQKNK